MDNQNKEKVISANFSPDGGDFYLSQVEFLVKNYLWDKPEARRDTLDNLLSLRIAIRNNKAEVKRLREDNAYLTGRIADQELKYADLGRSFDELCNNVWGLCYPEDATGWEYPAQVFRHIRDVLSEKNALIDSISKAAANDREEFEEVGQEDNKIILRLEAELTEATNCFTELVTIFDEILKASYGRDNFIKQKPENAQTEIAYLRERIKDLGLLIKQAKLTPATCPECKGAGKILDTAASHIQSPCPACNPKLPEACPDCGSEFIKGAAGHYPGCPKINIPTQAPSTGNYVTGVDTGKTGGDFTAFTYASTAYDEKTPPTYKDIKAAVEKAIEKEPNGKYKTPFNPFDSPEVAQAKASHPLADIFGFKVIESEFLPPEVFGIFNGRELVLRKIPKQKEPESLLKLRHQSYRERHIDRIVKDLLRKPKGGVTFNIEVKVEVSPAFEELKRKIESIRAKAEADIEGAVNSLLGKCKE